MNAEGKYEGFGVLYDKQKGKIYEGFFINGLSEGAGRTYTIDQSLPNFGHLYQG
jgi:hypothetical protein